MVRRKGEKTLNELFNRNHSSKNETTTQVKVDALRKTVGITLPKNMIEKARIHRLNLSRIAEQALSSILDYLETENIKPSSEFLTEGSFPKETSWAGRSVWYDRHVGIVEVAGSNPAPSTIF